jgi:ParB family chromosome partitioning protein
VLKGDDSVGIQLIKVPVGICDFRLQPRSDHDEAYCRSVGESVKAIGQQVPVIGYFLGKLFVVVDGACRCAGARMVGLTELLALDLGKEPTRAELLEAQAAIDIHKKHFRPMDRARLWQAIKEERGWTNRELAKSLGVSDSLIGDAMYLVTLPPDVQEKVNSGALDSSKASLIAQTESNPDRQRELADLGTSISRTALIAKMKKNRRDAQQTPVIRSNSIRCPLTSGVTVTVKGNGISLEDALDALATLSKEMKKASAEGIDGGTFSRMCSDRAKQK